MCAEVVPVAPPAGKVLLIPEKIFAAVSVSEYVIVSPSTRLATELIVAMSATLIASETAIEAARHGANILTAGSAIFGRNRNGGSVSGTHGNNQLTTIIVGIKKSS